MDIVVTFPGGKRVDAQAGAFTLKTDQPRDHGGEGSAPEHARSRTPSTWPHPAVLH